MDPWWQVPSQQIQLENEEPVSRELHTKLSKWFYERNERRLLQVSRRVGGGGGVKSTVYFAVTDGGDFAIRVPKAGTGWIAGLIHGCPEYHSIAGTYALTRLSALGQPVPELVAVELDRSLFGAPFAVFKRVRGVHMANYSQCWAKWPYPEGQWGEFLRTCHSIAPLYGAGPVNDDGVGLCASWEDCIRRMSAAYIERFAGYLPARFPADWRRLFSRYAPILGSRPVRLLHLESNGYCNLILDPEHHEIKAVLDFENTTAGDPLFEIVYMAWHLGRCGIADHGGKTCFRWRRFLQHYGTVDWRDPLVPFYRSVVLLEKLWRQDRRPRARRLSSIIRRLC